ncbi:MAG: type VI secretion system baseplate subunit TssE [Syntrophobacteraceae bacterium]|nr:type VI secretion system baseplate subunit TssE [Syntrophobacteraceae bacterium]
MAVLSSREHLQPSLLDRLTDLNPTSTNDTLEERVMSLHRLRDSLIRDLEWLLNTGRLEISQNLDDFPEVEKSVLNFGIPDISGVSLTHQDRASLEREIHQAILDFEPRILPGTLKVSVSLNDEEMNENTLVFEIQGDMWWQPLPERFYLRATLDVELGKFKKSSP